MRRIASVSCIGRGGANDCRTDPGSYQQIYCGAISVHPLGLELDGKSSGRRLEWVSLAAALPDPLLRTRRNVHKGSFGTLGIVGGNDGLVGAAILAARAKNFWLGMPTLSTASVPAKFA